MSLWQVYTEFNAQQSSILALEMKWSRKSNTWRWRTPSCILFYCTLILGNLSKHFLHQPHSNTPRTQPRPFPTGAAIVVWHHGCSLVKLGWMDVPRSTLRDVPWYRSALEDDACHEPGPLVSNARFLVCSGAVWFGRKKEVISCNCSQQRLWITGDCWIFKKWFFWVTEHHEGAECRRWGGGRCFGAPY